jgi:hypothetical protein
MRKVILFLLVISFGACMNSELANTGAEIFDLAAFINKLEEEKSFSNRKVEKLLFIDGKERERTEVSDYDAIEDLKMIKLSNINRPALIEKYSADKNEEDFIFEIINPSRCYSISLQSFRFRLECSNCTCSTKRKRGYRDQN